MEDNTSEREHVIGIDKRGDICLRPGEHAESSPLIRVSSKILSQASPVFNAMLSGNWSETTSSAPIRLPDDDPKLVELLCEVLHAQSINVFTDVGIVELADFAVLCDKYDCTDAASAWVQAQVQQELNWVLEEGSEKLIFITYVFDLPHEFMKVTELLLKERTFKVSMDVAAHDQHFLPLKLFDRFHKAELHYYTELQQALSPDHPSYTMFILQPKFRSIYDVLHTADPYQCTCGNEPEYFVSYMRALAKRKLFPANVLTLNEFENKIKEIPEFRDPDECKHDSCICRTALRLKEIMVADVAWQMREVEGLCLDCSCEMEDGKERECRVEHSHGRY
ncbi:hypothetical protein P154DRAFT_139787 [Amniculicola lignicola CBS 123094]|uniref:BTB domain-containing protein n=1 Tax=Amniculicola lignicola CBS 123094 TaxID=1392246 RepID=A0A6A5WKP2_9PLEO|nr:hypothetical protein P154DRAFT_139787 [Amniculicola lignicola CBS 123094]